MVVRQELDALYDELGVADDDGANVQVEEIVGDIECDDSLDENARCCFQLLKLAARTQPWGPGHDGMLGALVGGAGISGGSAGVVLHAGLCSMCNSAALACPSRDDPSLALAVSSRKDSAGNFHIRECKALRCSGVVDLVARAIV